MEIDQIQKKVSEMDKVSNDWVCYVIDADYNMQNKLILSLSDFFNTHNVEYWFMRKSHLQIPHLRVRFLNKNIKNTLNKYLEEIGFVNFKENIYEPEVYLFGNSKGLNICHNLFCELTNLYYSINIKENKKDTYIALVAWYSNYLVKNCIEDDFEKWDCWNRVLDLRDFDESNYTDALLKFTNQLKNVLNLNEVEVLQEIDEHMRNKVSIINKNLIRLSNELKSASEKGDLTRGIRGILSCIIIFMWNIFGIKPSIQATYAYSFTYLNSPDREK